MRCSGILMHISSLPGPYGIGTMGKRAFEFIDFLEEAGQSIWQILPLNPTGYGDSPYQSCSTFAGNHYLIDLDALVEEGLLEKEELSSIQWSWSETKADFGLLYNNRLNVLRKAYERFSGSEDFDGFCQQHSSWLPDFALFMALKGRFSGKPWYQWEKELKFREPGAVEAARQELAEEIRKWNSDVTCCETVEEAVTLAMSEGKETGIATIAFGSLSYLGEVRNYHDNYVKKQEVL